MSFSIDFGISKTWAMKALCVAPLALIACGSTKREYGTPESDGGGGNSTENAGNGNSSSAGSGTSASGKGGQGSGEAGASGEGAGDSSGGGTTGASGSTGASGEGGSGGGPPPICGAPTQTCCAGSMCLAGETCSGGTCSCNAKLSACEDGCFDFKSDPKNCGSCGHDCLGGDCNLGSCQPVQVVTGEKYVYSLATNGTYLFWGAATDTTSTNFYISRRRVDASDAVKPLVSNESGTSSLTLSGSKIFWFTKGHLRACDAPDCSTGASDFIPTVSSTNCGSSMLFSTPKNTLYWGCFADYDNNNGLVDALTIGTVNPLPIVPTPASPAALLSDDENLYWLNSSTFTNNDLNTDGAVARIRLSDGSKTTLASGLQAELGTFAIGGTTAYFAGNVINVPQADYHSIFKVPLPNGLGGAAPPRFVAMAALGNSVAGMVADDQYLYYIETGFQNSATVASIQRCPHSGCATPPEVIAPTQPGGAGAMIQDSVSIFWVSGASIWRLAK